MSKSILIHENGGPEKMRLEDVEVGAPGPGQVKIKHTAIGLNFIDVYTRSGLYQTPLPNAVGREAAGVILEVGPRVKGFKKGDRVAYCGVLGAYCQERLMGVELLVHVPKGVSDEQAAAIMLKGMTVCYLLRRTFDVKKGNMVLIHAAAGGVGLIASQWANALGATVIGTVGSKDKAALAKANGCHHTILYRDEDFVARVKDITGGALCDVVYDGVGKTTFPASLDCLRPLGMFVSFGSASGPVDAFNINLLQTKGSLFATRPTLNHYAAKREDLLKLAAETFDVISSGKVKIPVNQRYPLKDAQQAHHDLESRATTGASILLP